MASPSQKYRFNGVSSMTPENLEQLDEMLEDIYTFLSQSPLGSTEDDFDPSALVVDPGVLTSDNSSNLVSLTAATGNALISSGVGLTPVFGKIGLATHVSGTLAATNGGTGFASYAQGDLLYADTTTSLAKLAKDANATRYLSNTGASNNPAWAQVNVANGVTGDLPFANFVQASAASKLVGRGSLSGAGDYEEITIGTGLTMTGTTLTASGGGGSGNATDAGAFGSEPGTLTPDTGDLYFTTNAPFLERYNGADFIPWGPIYLFTPPVDADYAWINQGGASVSTTNGGILLSDVAGASLNFRIRKKAAPTVPYVITAAFLVDPLRVDFHQFGLLFREAGTGELHAFSIQRASSAGVTLQPNILGSLKYNSPTSFSAVYAQAGYHTDSLLWLRIADDNTNRVCSYSIDGQAWFIFHSVSRTDFLTADEVGFFVDVENATYGMGVRLVSWDES